MSSNAISLSQQDEPFGFGALVGVGGRGGHYSASQYLAPEMHDYRRLSAHFPPDLGLTQPVSTYGDAGSRLEPDPYVRSIYSHRRKHRSHSSSRNRIPEELRPDDSKNHRERESSSSSRDGLKAEDARLPGQKFSGASRSITNLSSSSRPPRYSSRNYMGSQEHLQPLQNGGRTIHSSTHRGSLEGIGAAVPAYAVGQALTQPVGVYPEEGETSMEMGWGQVGGVSRPSAKSSRKVMEANTKEHESRQAERNVRRTVSLSPPHIVVEGEESYLAKANGEIVGGTAAAMATGSTHHPNGTPSSGSSSENQIAKATSNQEEVSIVWEVIYY